MSATIEGIVERVAFHHPENGFAVLRVAVPGIDEPVTLVGNVNAVVSGEQIHAVGEWVQHCEHGRQFKATSIRTCPPGTVEGIKRYLGSGLIRGIGLHFAQRIVEKFGVQTLRIIDESPQFLAEIRGIGPKRIQQIRQSWQEQKAVRDIMIFLQSYGVGTARALRIVRTYGDQAMDLIRANPYRLCEEVWGIGFPTADQLALNMGFDRQSIFRARAAVRYVLRQFNEQGHVAYPEVGAVGAAQELTGIDQTIIAEAISEGCQAGEIVREPNRSTAAPNAAALRLISRWEPWLYTKPLYLAEIGVAQQLVRLRLEAHPLRGIDVEPLIEQVERMMRLALAPQQREALRGVTQEKVLIVTGGPGVGKTTIVRGMIEMFAASAKRVALCAPTGRAARRLGESTGSDAKTIHRLLEFDSSSGRFQHGRGCPLNADLVIVDEVSMVDLALMEHLIAAIPSQACLVLVGDTDQLPSVGPGNVLRDFINSGVVRVVRLSEVFRQAASSYIVRAAHAIQHGEIPEPAPNPSGDFFIVESSRPDAITERILTMIGQRIPERFGLDPLRDVQVLTPMNRTPLGAATLNQRLQQALNPPRSHLPEVSRFGATFRVGDKVMQLRNNYQREVFNGDVGRVVALSEIDQELRVDFDGREVTYDFADLDELSLAYACTIHKAQGSEFPAVVIPWHTSHYLMLRRNLLYTAITRGRRLVVLVGNRAALRRAVERGDDVLRYSRLAERIKGEFEKTVTTRQTGTFDLSMFDRPEI